MGLSAALFVVLRKDNRADAASGNCYSAAQGPSTPHRLQLSFSQPSIRFRTAAWKREVGMRLVRMVALIAVFGGPALAEPAQMLPTGQALTPLAAPGARFTPLVAGIGPNPAYVADGAAAIAVSPDEREMLVLTSGYQSLHRRRRQARAGAVDAICLPLPDRRGAARRLVQTLTVPNSYSAASPGGPMATASSSAAASTTISMSFARGGRRLCRTSGNRSRLATSAGIGAGRQAAGRGRRGQPRRQPRAGRQLL